MLYVPAVCFVTLAYVLGESGIYIAFDGDIVLIIEKYELSELKDDTKDVSVIRDRLAQMSCKAAVKGGRRISPAEADELFCKLLALDNPYNCPHGRPTMVEFTEHDLEKFFKRIV